MKKMVVSDFLTNIANNMQCIFIAPFPLFPDTQTATPTPHRISITHSIPMPGCGSDRHVSEKRGHQPHCQEYSQTQVPEPVPPLQIWKYFYIYRIKKIGVVEPEQCAEEPKLNSLLEPEPKLIFQLRL
jgi:hypothetical protein